MPKLKQFFFSDPEDRRNSGQIPAPNYSKSKSASICSTAQLPTNLLNAVKRGSNAQQHFQPVSIEVNQSSPTPPVTNQQPIPANLSNRRLSAINLNSISATSPTLSSTNLNTISGIHVPYPRSPQPQTNKNQHLLRSVVQSSGAINELGLVASSTSQSAQQQQQTKTPRTRSSISNLLVSPKLNSSNYDYQLDASKSNNNDFEFKNLNYTTNQSGGLRAPAYNKGRKYSCVAAINPIQSDAFTTHNTYLPNQIQKSRRHSRAVADIPSPSQLKKQERKQSNIQEYNTNLINQQQQKQYQNERTTMNRKKYSLANHHGTIEQLMTSSTQGLGSGEFNQQTGHLINKPLMQTQQEHQVRKYSNASSSTSNNSRKQSRTDLQQYIRDDGEPILQDYNNEFDEKQFYQQQFDQQQLDEQQFDQQQYDQQNFENASSKYQKRHSSAATHQHYHQIDSQQQQPNFNQFEETNQYETNQ